MIVSGGTELNPEQMADEYALEQLGHHPTAANWEQLRAVVRDAFLAGYLCGVMKGYDKSKGKR